MALWSALIARTSRTAQPVRPSLTFFFLVVGAFFLTLVPHVVELPVWLTVCVIVAITIRSVMEVHRLPLPSPTFCFLVALCLLIGVLLQFHNIFGRDAGMAFTAGLLAIKFFELRGPRDIAVIIFSGYFVVMSALLYSQIIELFIYCLIMMWVLTALLRRLQIGDQPEDRLLAMLQWSGIIFLQAVPLTVFLFFFFPRFSGKLQVNLGETPLGFTDTIRPGDIAALSQNNATAMYVTFENNIIPDTKAMYWRGLVLWHYQNGEWTAGKLAEYPFPGEPSIPPDTNLITQQITIEPHFQKWLFALDYPVKIIETSELEPQPWAMMLNGEILQLTSGPFNKVDHTERYRVVSALKLSDQTLPNVAWVEGTQLPSDDEKNDDPTDKIDPEVRALADRLYKENPDEQAYVHAVLLYFRNEHFIYDASPGVQEPGGKWLHQFLFTTKAGFCEHFASAFAVLMRLEHIPTRLVAGYHGASYNPYKNIYIVKQSDAHAWDEVWIYDSNQPASGQDVGQWQRVDPTAYLSPMLSMGKGSNNPNQDSEGDELSIQVAYHKLTISEAYLPKWMRHGLTEMQLRRQQVEADWDDLVFSYDPTVQNRLAQALGFGRDSKVLLGLACLVAAGLCVVVFQKWLKRKPPISPVEDLYASFCRNMAQRGIPRAVWEGPLAYTGRVAESFPEKETAIRDVGSIVAHSRYGPTPIEPTAPAELKSLMVVITASQTASSSREKP